MNHRISSTAPPEAPAVGVVIVSWNVRELLARCLESLRAAGLPTRIVVVDNASSDGSVEALRERFADVTWLVNADNAGFTRANNQGFRLLGHAGIRGGEIAPEARVHGPARGGATGGTPDGERGVQAVSPPDWTLILNPDTELDPETLDTLVDDLRAHPEAGAVGPALFYPDGRPQPSRRRFPSLLAGLVESTPIGWRWPNLPPVQRLHMRGEPEAAGEVDWVTGAAILLRREALEAAGGFDEGFFMYSEELDLCRRLHAAGWRVRYNPAARVLHHEGQSSDQVAPRRHRMFQRSRIRYFGKHHGALAGFLLRWGILAQYAVELVVEALKGALGHRRELRRERVSAYAALLRDGLHPEGLERD